MRLCSQRVCRRTNQDVLAQRFVGGARVRGYAWMDALACVLRLGLPLFRGEARELRYSRAAWLSGAKIEVALIHTSSVDFAHACHPDECLGTGLVVLPWILWAHGDVHSGS